MKPLLYTIVAVVAFVTFCLYLVSRPSYKDVSDQSPFAKIVGRELVTQLPVVIARNPTSQPIKYDYIIEDGTNYDPTQLDVIVEVSVGTRFTISKVELHTSWVSGTTSAYLFGQISSDERKVNFEYNWGEYHVLYQDVPYWTFGRAFWQLEPLKMEYVIKK